MKSIPPTIKSMLSVFLFFFLSPVIHSTAQEIQKPAEIKKEVESKSPKVSEQPKSSVQPAPLKPPAPAALPVPITDRIRSALGMVLILGGCYAFSTNRKAISKRVVLWGLGLQWLLAFLVLSDPRGASFLNWLGRKVEKILACSEEGAAFVFGKEAINPGGAIGFVFAFRVLPTVIFMSAMFAVMYHLGVMQFVVSRIAWVMKRLMGISGAESLNVAASLFLGQTEAPLTIRPFLPKLTQSELLTVMASGMAHVSGGMMGAYFAYGIEPQHILTAVIMTAPGTILISKLLIPETGEPETLGFINVDDSTPDTNLLDAASRGTREGLGLSLNIAAMLISFISLITFTNLLLGQAGILLNDLTGSNVTVSLQSILGFVLSPVAWLLGVPWSESSQIGSLLGTRTILNELIAYQGLGELKGTLQPRSFAIASFALCGFANLGSIGIQLGGIGALAPERRSDLAKMGLKAMIAGTLANYLSACIVGIIM
jgi:CNT family concentrative nucleoside transporter